MSNAYSGIVAVVVTLGALLVVPLPGCGSGNDEPPVEYQFICEKRQNCIGTAAFLEQYGSINECAEQIDDSFFSTDSECGDARNAEYGCRLKHYQCTDGEPTLSEKCESAATNRIKACFENEYVKATTEDITAYCKLLKYCTGDSAFQERYGGVAGCVNNYESAFSNLEDDCEEEYSEAMFCEIRNFQCEDGENASDQNCEDVYDDIGSDCSL